MRQIFFYQVPSGEKPVEEFLNSLNGKQAQKIVWVLKLIEELPVVPPQYFKKLVNTDDIWEARAGYGGEIFRILGFFEVPERLILTNGFKKKQQKTPQQEIDLATRRKREHLLRQQRKGKDHE